MQLHTSAHAILLDQQDFAPRFYERLFREHPETEAYFNGVDMHEQRAKLMAALITAERQATRGGWVSENYLAGLGQKHLSLGVRRELFPLFVDTVVATLKEYHGRDWSAVLESEWRRAMDRAVALMLEQYPESESET